MSSFLLGTILAQVSTIRCPHCGHQRSVDRRPVAYRICPVCVKRFPDPLAPKA
jgi:DNA-directed RNA polymerase subunit RPC12/RpoP